MNGSTDMSMELLMNSDNPEKVLQTMQPFIESMMFGATFKRLTSHDM